MCFKDQGSHHNLQLEYFPFFRVLFGTKLSSFVLEKFIVRMEENLSLHWNFIHPDEMPKVRGKYPIYMREASVTHTSTANAGWMTLHVHCTSSYRFFELQKLFFSSRSLFLPQKIKSFKRTWRNLSKFWYLVAIASLIALMRRKKFFDTLRTFSIHIFWLAHYTREVIDLWTWIFSMLVLSLTLKKKFTSFFANDAKLWN